MERIELTKIEDVYKTQSRLYQLSPQKQGIVVFGSARVLASHASYEHAYHIAKSLVKHGYFIVTGGGNGIMEAANKGAKEAGGFSVGLNISLPHEEKPNNFLDMQIHFEEFWLRKFFFEKVASAFVIFTGGFGTLDELFDILVLLQTQKRNKRPVILYGKEFWTPLIDFFHSTLLANGCIAKDEMELIQIVDCLEQLEQILFAKSQESVDNGR